MRIVFSGGGTGGHIYPALTIAGEIARKRPDAEIRFITGTKEVERRILSEAGYPADTIPVVGMPRAVSPGYVAFAWKLIVSVVRSRNIMGSFRPVFVMATGGYVAGPPIIAARMLGIPVVIQEQNSFPGITNRKLARFADIVFLGLADAGKYFPDTVETVVTGNPVRREIGTGERGQSAAEFGLNPGLKTVLVFGGSQGSRALNSAVSKIVESMAEKGVQFIWQTGRDEFEMYERFDRRGDGRVRVLPYIDDMVSAYGAADLVVSRAGAMTIAEITVCGLPAVFVPLPTAAGNHQEHNALSLVRAGAAEMIRERDMTPERLENVVMSILSSGERLAAMSKASEKMGRKEAASAIADMLIERYGDGGLCGR